MPVYNVRHYIAEAVRSVLASDFRSLELLILDDGSTDGSADEALRAAAGDPRVRVLALDHGGVGAARNTGLAAARGEFIANLDADDVTLPSRFTRQVRYLDAHPECVAVGSRALIIDAAGTPLRIGGRLYSHEAIDEAHLDGRPGAILNPTAMFRRQIALDVGGYAAHLQATGEDHDLWLRMAEAGRVANLPQVLIRYRIHDANVSVGAGTAERRLATTLDTLARAFERRGITERTPARGSRPATALWERWSDRALLHHFSGRRWKAVMPAVTGWLLRPTSPATRAALRTVLFPAPTHIAGSR